MSENAKLVERIARDIATELGEDFDRLTDLHFEAGFCQDDFLRAAAKTIEALRSERAGGVGDAPAHKFHDAFQAANIEYSGMSWDGFNLFGDRRSIDEARRLRHEAEKVSALQTQLIEARAALSAAPQATVPDGWVLVPKHAIAWLLGDGPDHNGHWFGDHITERTTPARYWWRTHFRNMLSAAPHPAKAGRDAVLDGYLDEPARPRDYAEGGHPMIGDNIKVRLPGEALWAIVTAELPDGRVMARLDNHTASNLHGYKYGDVVTFKPDADARVPWILSPLEQQAPVGPRPHTPDKG